MFTYDNLSFPRLSQEPFKVSTGMPKFLVIGFGVFGASTARHLVDLVPRDELESTVIDVAYSEAASNDISKMIRVDYASLPRMKAVIHAQKEG